MTTLMRWDPFREMTTVRNMMDRWLEDPLFAPRRMMWEEPEGFPVALDVAEDDENYIVKASVPGVDPDQVEITLTDNVLTIKGETKVERDVEEKNYHVRERRYGHFTRSITLPTPVDPDKVDATHENGILTLHLPKHETAKPKRIAVKTTVDGK